MIVYHSLLLVCYSGSMTFTAIFGPQLQQFKYNDVSLLDIKHASLECDLENGDKMQR